MKILKKSINKIFNNCFKKFNKLIRMIKLLKNIMKNFGIFTLIWNKNINLYKSLN